MLRNLEVAERRELQQGTLQGLLLGLAGSGQPRALLEFGLCLAPLRVRVGSPDPKMLGTGQPPALHAAAGRDHAGAGESLLTCHQVREGLHAHHRPELAAQVGHRIRILAIDQKGGGLTSRRGPVRPQARRQGQLDAIHRLGAAQALIGPYGGDFLPPGHQQRLHVRPQIRLDHRLPRRRRDPHQIANRGAVNSRLGELALEASDLRVELSQAPV